MAAPADLRRAGFNDPDWDREFLDAISDDPAALAELTHAEYAQRGGLEGAEVNMWLVMRGALSARVRRVHSSYTLPSMARRVAGRVPEDEQHAGDLLGGGDNGAGVGASHQTGWTAIISPLMQLFGG